MGHLLSSLRVRLSPFTQAVFAAALGMLSPVHSLADWPNTNATKWVQYPDTNVTGFDVTMRQPLILASDFLCTNTGPITDIHLWTSYLNDTRPATNIMITLSIWSDLPAGSFGTNYSRPGTKLWSQTFTNGQYQVRLWVTNVTESFWNPDMGPNILGADHAIWQYNFYPTNPFIQQGTMALPTVYWLSANVSGLIGITNIGWKTATNRWNDDSVYAHLGGLGGTNLIGSWLELTNPVTSASLDLAFALTTTNPPPSGTNVYVDKWLQIPDTSPNGMDVGPVELWDDFRCNATGPITRVRVWGSWLNDNLPPFPPQFIISIWTDVPAGLGTNYSTPGRMICQYSFLPGEYTFFPYASGLFEQFMYIDLLAGTNGIIGSDTTIWEYVFDMPTNQPCIQTNGNIYWLGVSASGYQTPPYVFGWKTCPTNWNDDAVWLANLIVTPETALDWRELRRPPGYSNSLDMAFEILTGANAVFDTNKWLQVPDTSTNGLDVKATSPRVMADDFRCTATGPITEVKVWGSWNFDQLPPTNMRPCFNLGIWSDVPATNGNYSHPGNLLCNYFFFNGNYGVRRYTNNVLEQFYDPFNGLIGSDTQIWEYTFNLGTNPPCIQTNGNIYWLSISADCFDPGFPSPLFGWKSCPTNFNDDAVFGDSVGFGSYPPFWFELHRPPPSTNSLDLAFQILTTPGNGDQPPNVPTNKWLQEPDTSTNGLDVQAMDPKLLADDFLCTLTGPITQIRLWGSWLDDKVPLTPPCICLGLWTDVPRNGPNFSHPGNQICNYCFGPGQYVYFPYTNGVFERFYNPSLPGTNGLLGTDTVIWEYVFNLPTNTCWYQTNGNVYWLSVNANCLDQAQFRFGWKTYTTNWNDDAVMGDLPGANWIDLHQPDATNSIDLSFQLTTGTNPCPAPALSCLPDKTVQCGTPWFFDPPSVLTNGCGTNYTLRSVAYTNKSACLRATITWILTDCCSNEVYCSQSVTINDFNPPSVTCPVNKTVECGTAWSFDTPTAVDDCCGTNVTVTVLSTITNGSTCLMTLTRNWQIADCCSNTAFCSQSVTVRDITPPVISCFPNKTVQCGVGWTFDTPSAVDACCGANVTVTVASTVTNGTPCNGMRFVRTWQAVDCCGNGSSCSQMVTNPPITVPQIVCATNKTITCVAGWTFDPPTVPGGGTCCTNLTLTILSTITNSSCCHTAVVTRAWHAIDCCSNSLDCTQRVTVVDTNTGPVVNCASNKTVLCGTAWTFNPPVGADTCCGTNVAVSILDTVTNGCAITRRWVVTKDCYPVDANCTNGCITGASVCTQIVTLIDTNKPTIICPTNIIFLTCSTNTPIMWSLSATDACSSVTVTSSPPSGASFNRDTTNTVLVVATDACGNTNSCSFLVIVRRPTLNIVLAGGTNAVVLSWADGGILQDATNVLGPWTDRPLVTSPYTNAITTARRFYRLRCP